MEKASAMLAVLACLLAAFVAPFASADDTAADAAQLPDHIVNGDFEYHSDITGNSWGWAAVIPTTGENYSGRWQWQAGPSDWDETKFGWHSTQNCDDGGECRTGAVELQQFWRSNTWAEIVAAQADTSIYQDIRVTPGNTYHWSLKHQSVQRANTMQVLIGAPGKEQPQLFADFTDLTVPNRYRVEWAVSADGTRTGAFTYRYNPPDPSLGSSQSGIRYEPNGGQGDAYLTVGDPDTTVAAAPAGTFTGTGLTFVGWNTERDGSGRAVMPDDMIAYPKEGSILTLYAQWKRIPETVLPDTGGHAGASARILAGGGLPYSADSSSHRLRNAGDAIWSDPHHARHGKEGVTCAV